MKTNQSQELEIGKQILSRWGIPKWKQYYQNQVFVVSTELDSQNAGGPAQDIWGQCVLEGLISYLLWDDWDNTRPPSLVSINILPSH